VKTLNTPTEGVEKAELGIDGYTIFITYKDGNEAAIDTYNEDDFTVVDTYEPGNQQTSVTGTLNNGRLSKAVDLSASVFNLTSNFPELFKSTLALVNTGITGLKTPTLATGSFSKSTSKSKKVLLLAPIGPEGWHGEYFSTAPTDCANYFKTHGWTDSDITVKMNTSKDLPNNLIVRPEDYYNLSDYGIILFFGHGFVRENYNNDNLYLQFANVTKKTYDNNVQQGLWDPKQLLICDKNTSADGTEWYCLFIRGDLLKQKLGKLPSSYVQLATCFGGYFSNIFIDDGAKIFLGWDNVADSKIADSNQSNMIKLMLDGSFSGYDAYQDISINKSLTAEETGWKALNCRFNIYPSTDAASSYYLPGWINVNVTGLSQLSNIKKGASYISVTIFDEESDSTSSRVEYRENLRSGQTQVEMMLVNPVLQTAAGWFIVGGLYPPGQYKIAGSGLNTNYYPLLSYGYVYAKVNPGLNNVQIQVVNQEWTDPMFTAPDGWVSGVPVETTTPTSTTATPTTQTSIPPTTTTPTSTVPTTQTSTPLTQVKVWLTTTKDSTAPPVSTFTAGSVTGLYIWAQGGDGQTGDFNLWGTYQTGTRMALGSTHHATPGEIMYCGTWNGGFLNTVGVVKVEALSGSTVVGSTTFTITQ